MADPKEIPQQVSDLIEMTKQYLRQEALDPIKNIGRVVAGGLITGLLMALGALLVSLGMHGFLSELLPEGQWWSAAAAAITAVVFFLAAFLVSKILRTADE